MPSQTTPKDRVMLELSDAKCLQQQLDDWREAGETIGFVPTMGFLHEGHRSLIRLAREHATRVIVSIFVNPTQFGPHEDLDRYPSDLDGDRTKIKSAGAHLLFLPSTELLYPNGAQTFIEVQELAQPLCGITRPNHFRGVATIVAKFFQLIRPDVAVFGEKDFQQLAIIRQMVKDLYMKVRIIGGTTIRESDGLALSSRNSYLDPKQREAAVCLSQAIREVRKSFAFGERQATEMIKIAKKTIEQTTQANVQYLELRDASKLHQVVGQVSETDRLFLAVQIGQTRLIDNAPVGGMYPL